MRPRLSRRCLAGVSLAASSLCAAAPASAQNPPPDSSTRRNARQARTLGVLDETTGQPLAGVDVIDLLTGRSAVTAGTGTVSLDFLATGGGLVRLRKLGYESRTLPIMATPADTAPVTVMLKRVAELPAVVTKDSSSHYISTALRGFEERRRNRVSGYFIDEATLRKEDGRPLANVLKSYAPSVRIAQVSNGSFLVKSPRCTSGGQPDVYINGVATVHLDDPRWRPLRRPSSAAGGTEAPPDAREFPVDLAQFQVADLAGVEYYPDNPSIPVQFGRSTAGCGALFLWTREK